MWNIFPLISVLGDFWRTRSSWFVCFSSDICIADYFGRSSRSCTLFCWRVIFFNLTLFFLHLCVILSYCWSPYAQLSGFIGSLCDWDPSNLWIHYRQEERKMSMTTLLQLHIYHDWPITATANRHQGSWCVFLANIWLAELRESRKWHLSFSLPFSSALTQTWERCMHIDKLLTAYLVACFWLGGLLHQTFELEFLFPSPWIK